MTTLLELTRGLPSLDEESTIYAAEPWTPQSQALVAQEPPEGGLPAEAQRLGFKYFLEVAVARDFLDGWKGNLVNTPTLTEECERLIQYAATDA